MSSWWPFSWQYLLVKQWSKTRAATVYQHAITDEEVNRETCKKVNMLSCHLGWPLACINMVTGRGAGIFMGKMAWRWCVTLAVLLGGSRAATLSSPADDADNVATSSTSTKEHDDYLLKQVVWKRCYRKISPACLKLNLVRTVELMSKDSSLALVPGVFFTSNASEFNALPPDIARSLSSEHAPLDDLVAFTVGKYLRSLTLNVNIVDFVSGGNETIQRSVIDAFSGRARKTGLMGGYGAIAAMMGGMMTSMMMAALAALAGKAMMTSLLALMMAAFAAMRGGGGGGGSKTYEVITKPVVSHIDTHSSEVQHEHHGHYRKRSLELDEHEGLEKEQKILNQEKEAEHETNQKVLEDMVRRRPEMEDVDDSKDYTNGREYYLTDLKQNKEDTKNINFNDPAEESLFNKRRSLDLVDIIHAGQEKNSDIRNSEEKDYDRFKRGLENSNPSRSTLPSVLLSGGTNVPLLGHPRQNHKEFSRNTDDDLLMTFGLFR